MDRDELDPARADQREGHDARLSLAKPSPWRLSAWLWSLLVLLGGLALALSVHHQQQQRRLAEQSFVRGELANKTFAALQDKLHSAEAMLRAVQTLFLASDQVTQVEFANFYTNLRPREQFPSLLALAYAQREQDGAGERYMTRWVEPASGNAAVIGLDVGAQPNNLAGLLASRDSDQATLSAPFRPVQQRGASGTEDGITLRLPVFSPGDPPQSLAQRHQRMRGSIAVSFRVSTLIDSVLQDDVRRDLRLQLADVTEVGHVLPLFDSMPGTPDVRGDYRFERRLAYGGRVWDVVMQPRDTTPPAIDWRQSTLPGGLLVSLLLALLVYSIVGTRQRALELGWQMSRRYRESEERFRALNELLPALVLLAEVDGGRITYANRTSRDRLGDQVTEQRLPDLFDDEILRGQLSDAETRGCSRIEARLHNTAGAHFWASVAISRIELGGVGKLLMVASDITEQRQLTELLSHQASHDALTDLYNRREFERRLHDSLAAGVAGPPIIVLLYVDLDQFKLINDTSGHLAGDQLLAQLSIVMRKQLGGTDVLARLGGDEFGVLLTRVADQQEAERIAERVRRCIDGYVFIWEQRSYTISASIGGVVAEPAGISAKDLLTQADTACYVAKESGRNRVHFYSERDDQTVRRRSEMEWANRLRWAVDEHRLQLTYQEVWPLPLGDGAEPGIEMLLRFREESGQLVVPGVFLPAAERYGLMPSVDRWVIETTLANFERLHPAGNRLDMVAINLSGASIEDPALVDRIIELLQRYRVEPSRVCFEITETVAVRNLSQVVRCMALLRSAGCRIALDDFGAGMSSFTYLKNLPLDIIKIDGSFVRDMLTDPVSHLMVKAVTDIGHRLGLEVIAEWVADAETVQALTALGVNRVQGFSLHHPELAVFQRD
ncbi:bifunctional diguanylate cyclase/phosphodiesterase [Rhodanobacter spathiphylli]|uniref:PAS/PAC and Chase sensor-containing diguanylate cyclase/phosphodiesterase n=1 Tax=Rhodanobacter spathiphylli B39 TaxID=1163407 RepID=I4W356_9GAMM|nr:EAL domain-containing protein [Rhodanobacter spathiphylli]EIL93897.1 PAS/PAC and Chase sensor-containing diguanylate cyclase/phosphodiesterase [Rhodanobacter spathiphylli B39]